MEPYVCASVLTETFEDAQPLARYLDDPKNPLNRRIANLGLKMFYKMLIYDNFIHADCHAGNIMIRVINPPDPSTLTRWERFNR